MCHTRACFCATDSRAPHTLHTRTPQPHIHTPRGTHVREVRTHARTTGPTRCAHRGPHAAQPSRRRRRRGARTGQDAHPQTQERLLCPLAPQCTMTSPVIIRRGKIERERDTTNAVPPHQEGCVFRYPGGMASTGGGLISVWPFASEGSESTLREADVLATLPMYDPGMYDPGMLASWYRRRYGSVWRAGATRTGAGANHNCASEFEPFSIFSV
jgi:hypothetical protein